MTVCRETRLVFTRWKQQTIPGTVPEPTAAEPERAAVETLADDGGDFDDDGDLDDDEGDDGDDFDDDEGDFDDNGDDFDDDEDDFDDDDLDDNARPRILERSEHPLSRKLISASAVKVLYRLHNGGYRGYLVGGSVRDLLLDRRPKDFDVRDRRPPEPDPSSFPQCPHHRAPFPSRPRHLPRWRHRGRDLPAGRPTPPTSGAVLKSS